MPVTAQDLLRMADEPAADPRDVAVQPRAEQPGRGFGTLQEPEPSPARAMADAFAEATPGPQAVKGFVRGAVERVAEPVGRLAGAAGHLSATGELPPEQSAVGLVGDVMEAGYAIHPETRLLAAGGAAVQGIAEQLGLTQNSARMLSIAAETGLGARSFLRAGKVPAREGAKLLERGGELRRPVTPTGMAQLTMPERVGADLAGTARKTLINNKRVLGQALDKLEPEIVRTTPEIAANSPGYRKLADALSMIEERQVKFPGDIGAGLNGIATRIANGEPVATADVMKLRTRLRQLTTFKDSADPDMALAAKNAGAVRKTITDAVEASIPDEHLLGRWVEARTAYNTQYATPWRNLRSIVKRDVTPQQAFNRVFNPNDMHTFRALTNVVGQSPAIRGKLQMGFLESLADATQGFEQAEQAHNAFNTMRPALAASGVFSHKELEALELFMRRRELPNLMEKVKSVLDAPLTVKGTGVGTALGFFAMHNPVLGISAMIGSGALPQLRRIAVLPAGSPAARRLAAQAVAKTAQFADALRKAEDPIPDDELGLDNE